MDELLQQIKKVERESIEDVEQAKLKKDEAIKAASTEARRMYERELESHHEGLKAKQDTEVEDFKVLTEKIIAKGKVDAEGSKRAPAGNFEKAVKTVYEMVARG